MTFLKTLALGAGLAAMVATGLQAADKPVTVKAVGTWGSLTNYQKHEGPFWNDHIAQATDG
ncbi:MAG: transporter, partial [Pseudomonadota bacterium]